MMDSVKKAFVLCPKALKLFYVIAAVNVAAAVINIILVPAPVSGEMSFGRSLAVIAVTVLMFLVALVVQGGALAFVRDLIKTGSAEVKAMPDNGKKYFVRLLGLTLLLIVVAVAVTLVSGLILGVLPTVVKVLLGIVIGLAFMVFLVMPAYALVGGDQGVMAALKTGVLMGKNLFVQILVVLVIMAVAGIVIFAVAAFVTGLLSLILKPVAALITGIVMGIVNAILTVLVNIAFMDIYLKNQA